jgi:hypothetical protein
MVTPKCLVPHERIVVSLFRKAKEGTQVKRLAAWATLLPFYNL